MAEAHVKEAEERLARERQRSSELAAALRKANRQTAEARKTHAAALMELDERMSCLDAEREESVASLSASMALLVERTAALLAGRKPGNRKQVGSGLL